MGIRVLAVLLLTFVGIPASFLDAFYGLLTYGFWSYAYPEKLTWGLLPMSRLSYVVGLVLCITTVMQKKRLFANNARIAPILIFTAWCVVSLYAISDNQYAFGQSQYFLRAVLVTLIMTIVIDDRKKLRQYLWLMAIVIGFLSARSGSTGILTGYVGPGGGGTGGFKGVAEDRNYMAVLLCATIPVFYYMGNTEKNRWLKLLLRGIFAGAVCALILTYARAGFLGLLTVGVFIVLRSKRKMLTIVATLSAALIFFNFIVPKEYIGRLSTIKKLDVQEKDADVSAAVRLVMWRIALGWIKEHPMEGVGFYNSGEISVGLMDPVTGIVFPRGRAIHNSVLQVAAELGLPAFMIYALIFASAYFTLGKIRRRAKSGRLEEPLGDYATMFQASILGFFSSAFFVNAAFIEISWHIVGLSIVLEEIAKKETAIKEIGPAAAAVEAEKSAPPEEMSHE